MRLQHDLQELLAKHYKDKNIRVIYTTLDRAHHFEIHYKGGRANNDFTISRNYGTHPQVLRAAFDAATFNIDLMLSPKGRR